MSRDKVVTWLLAAGVCLFALVLYFPTAFVGSGLILPADILYSFPPFNSYLPMKIQNILISDPVMHMYPWFVYGREMFWNGDVPLWNPLVNAGAPLVANDQSAFFFPLNILGYFLPVKAGWNFVILGKLALAYAGMWLFLRHKGLGRVGRTFGALTFMLSGSMMIWLGWPHTNVIMTLPWLFYTLRAWYLNRQYRWGVAFILVVAIQFLGGFIEESAHILFFTGLYGLLLIATTANVRPRDQFSSALMMLLLVVSGTALAAVQLVPFAEFVMQTTAVAKRSHPDGYGFLHPNWAISWLIPNYFGNQVYGNYSGPVNYNEVIGYAGIGTIVMALVGLWRRWRETFPYVLLTVICFGLLYKVPGIVLLKSLPGFNMALTGRLLMTAAFLLAVLAAYGVDNLTQTRDGEDRLPHSRFIMTMIGIYLIIPFVIAFGRDYLSKDLLAQRSTWVAVAVTLALAVGFAAWARIRQTISAQAFAALVLIAQFVDLYSFSKPYNPVVPIELAYPAIPMVEVLQRDMKHGDRFIGMDRILPPNLSVAYRIPDLRNSDAVFTARDTALMKVLDLDYEQAPDKYSVPVKPDVQMLSALGVTHVIGRAGVPPGVATLFQHDQSSRPVGEIQGAHTVYQEFTSTGEPVGAIDIMLATYNRQNRGLFEVALLRDDQTLASTRVDMSQVRDNAYFRMEFPPIESRKGEKLGIRLSSPDGKPGSALTAWYDPSTKAPGTSLQVAGRPTPGTLRFRVYGASRTQLEKLWEDEHGYAIWRLKDARPFAYLASQVVTVPEEQALETLVALSREPGRGVVVEQEAGQVRAGGGEVVSFQRPSAGKIEVSVKADEAALLVVNEKFSPGWKASIDGAETKTLRANYAFTAVVVPPGNHLVQLEYRPLGWTIGWLISVATLLLLVAFGGLRWYLRRHLDKQAVAAEAGGETKQLGVK